MKKTDNETTFIKSAMTRVAEFISKYSVYGIFAVVLIAICTITILSLPSGNQDNAEGDPTPHIIDAATYEPTLPPPAKTPSAGTPTPMIPPQSTPTPDSQGTPIPTPKPTPDNTGVDNPQRVGFAIVLPFASDSILTEFSNTVPIYSQTLDQWSCHVGLDFGCNENDTVASAANGIIKSITTDDVYGTTIIIEHEDDFFTLYRGIKDVCVREDELVAEGQILGKASGDIPYEAHIPTHVHFELIKDSLCINPHSFVK